MCGKFTLTSNLNDIIQSFGISRNEYDSYEKKYNIAPTQLRTKNMLIHSVVPFVDTRICSYNGREAVFI